MVDTIETFVAKLQKEGVQAGQAAAEKLQVEAKGEAETILAEAEEKARKIIADAEEKARNILARSKTELDLGARDTVCSLRDALSAGLNAILSEAAKDKLDDADFLGKMLQEIIMVYARADKDHDPIIEIKVPEKMREKLKQWVFDAIAKETTGKSEPSINLKGGLRKAGFEYEVDAGGTVEVTLASVVETLSKLVAPDLRDVLVKAAENAKT